MHQTLYNKRDNIGGDYIYIFIIIESRKKAKDLICFFPSIFWRSMVCAHYVDHKTFIYLMLISVKNNDLQKAFRFYIIVRFECFFRKQ